MLRWIRRLLRPRDVVARARHEYRRVYDMGERLSATTEVIAESALHLERSAARAQEVVAQLNGLLAVGVAEVLETNGELTDLALRRLVDAKTMSLPLGGAELLNYALGHHGFAAQRGLWFNPPVLTRHLEGDVVVAGVNERIVEVPWVMGALADLPAGARVIDVGAAESTLALSLACLGFEVIALDPRGYPLQHPNLTVAAAKIEDWGGDRASVDAIVCLSVIEHLGLDAYGEGRRDDDGDAAALRHVRRLLKPEGVLALTVPFGSWSVDEVGRTYDAPHLAALLEEWTVERQVFVERTDDLTWLRATPRAGTQGVMLITARP